MDNIDFYTLCLEEGHPFYSNVYPVNKEDFNNWVAANLEEIATIENYEEVLPTEDLMENLRMEGYTHRHYQCHYSAKALSIIDNQNRYFSGFLKRYSIYYPIITHSFNLRNNGIIDLARINNPDYPLNGEDSFPHTYYGIEIPREFILNYNEETINDYSMNPVLIDWYIANN